MRRQEGCRPCLHGGQIAGHSQAHHGFSHIALSSDDIWADYERLREKEVAFISEPIEFRPQVWGVYFRGPDGETCEMRQA